MCVSAQIHHIYLLATCCVHFGFCVFLISRLMTQHRTTNKKGHLREEPESPSPRYQ